MEFDVEAKKTETNCDDDKLMEQAVELFKAGEAEIAFSICLSLAKKGHPRALFNVGLSYIKGEGVEQDLKTGILWYEKAANQGYGQACNALGVCYSEGKGVEKDLEKAFRYFEKGAELGHKIAKYNLAQFYFYGKGVVRDNEKAIYWYHEAAKAGHAEAQYRIGVEYFTGGLVYKCDRNEALKWFKAAAEQGHEGAKERIVAIEKQEKLERNKAEKPENLPFAMTVENVYHIVGRGTLVEGTIETGYVKMGDFLQFSGSDGERRSVTVTGIEKSKSLVDAAKAGEKVLVTIRGKNREYVQRGDVLVHQKDYL